MLVFCTIAAEWCCAHVRKAVKCVVTSKHTHTHTQTDLTEAVSNVNPKCAQLWGGNAVLLHLLVSGRVSPLPRLLSWRDAALPALRSCCCCFTGRLLWGESHPAVTNNNAAAPSSPRPLQPPPSLRVSVRKHWPSVQTSAAVASLSPSLSFFLFFLSLLLSLSSVPVLHLHNTDPVGAAGVKLCYF